MTVAEKRYVDSRNLPATVVQLLMVADGLEEPYDDGRRGPRFCRRCSWPLDEQTACDFCTQSRRSKASRLRETASEILERLIRKRVRPSFWSPNRKPKVSPEASRDPSDGPHKAAGDPQSGEGA